MLKRFEPGDTIVEVLFAVTVFSLIAVGGLSLMNQGTAMAQRSLEIGLVRDQMDAQADALRYIHNAYVANFGNDDATTSVVWRGVAEAHAVNSAQPFAQMTDGERCQLPAARGAGSSDGEPFVLDINKLDGQNGGPVVLFSRYGTVTDMPISRPVDDDYVPTFAQIRYPPEADATTAEGIWMQSVRVPGNNGHLGYFDFHIRACWLTPGQLTPVTLGTIVRLYDPAS